MIASFKVQVNNIILY